MNNKLNEWSKLKKIYLEDHFSKPLKQVDRRVSALTKIETFLVGINGFDAKNCTIFFERADKKSLIQMLETIKGAVLNSAEKSVVTGLYKFLPEV